MQDSQLEVAQHDEELWAYDEGEIGRRGLLSGRSAVWLVAPLIVVLLGVGGVGAHLLLEEIPEEPAVGEQAKPVTCWDHEVRPAQNCGLPTGRLGLRWVFPSFKPTDQGCRNLLRKNPDLDRPTMFECTPRLDGAPVTLVYSEVRGVDKARRYLERRYGGEPRVISTGDGEPGWWRWRETAARGDGELGLEQMYVDYPYSVEVRADSVEIRDRALDELVRWRSPDMVTIRSRG